LADKWVLSKAEVAELKAATDAYQNKTVATAKELAFVDVNALLTQVATWIYG
jgi:hypothetical protein